MKRFLAAAALALGLVGAAVSPSAAQEWPKKQPIKIIVAANAGGGTDVMARVAADFLSKRLGQAVVVENRPGGSASIGIDYVAKSAPDGYTLLFIAAELTVLPAVRTDLPYKFDELTYLYRAFSVHPIMLGSPKLPANTIPELVAYMKANPGKVRYGSTGVGAIVHMGLAAFEGAAGGKAVHVPYTGIAPIYTDMLAGNIEITQATPPFAEGLKVLGSVGSKRNPNYPDLPTLSELGMKSAEWDIWFGFIGPPKMPKELQDRVTSEITAMMKDPEVIAKYQSVAKIAPDTAPGIGDAFKKEAMDSYAKWKAVAEREKISVQ